jgi:hypothetical protein
MTLNLELEGSNVPFLAFADPCQRKKPLCSIGRPSPLTKKYMTKEQKIR